MTDFAKTFPIGSHVRRKSEPDSVPMRVLAALSDTANHIYNGIRVCNVCGDDLHPDEVGPSCRPCASDREASEQ